MIIEFIDVSHEKQLDDHSFSLICFGLTEPCQMGASYATDSKPWRDLQYAEVQNAVEKGNESAKTLLAWFLLSGRGGAPRNVEQAVALLEERVKKMDKEAMWMLGLCAEYAIGMSQDKQRAWVLYCQSADGGNDVSKCIVNQQQDFIPGSRGYAKGDGKFGIWLVRL